jgi:hypothetical protein
VDPLLHVVLLVSVTRIILTMTQWWSRVHPTRVPHE